MICKMVCGTGWYIWNQQKEGLSDRGVPCKMDNTKWNYLKQKDMVLKILAIY